MTMAVGRPCAYFGCRRTAQFESDYCHKHRNEMPQTNINSDGVSTDDGTGISNQIIRFEIDGKKKTIDSKEIDNLLSRLKKAKKFWIVDLTVDEEEFVQYAIEKGELEHWDRLEMIESMEMTPDEAFSTLFTKITGDYSGHLMWWSDQPLEGHSEEELDQQENNPAIIVIGIFLGLFILGIFLFSGDPASVMGNFAGEALCQLLCFPIALLGGAGATTLGRSDSGKFT